MGVYTCDDRLAQPSDISLPTREVVMFGLTNLEVLFVAAAFIFQIILIVHFSLRKWRFEFTIRHGWIVYGLGIPAAVVSMILLRDGLAWSFCLAGFLYLIWAIFGFTVEYVRKLEWRSPIRWSIFGPYIFLYLATIMFYWFPLALLNKPLWYAYALLFILSTILNVISHKRNENAN
jgi:hypothetical protein